MKKTAMIYLSRELYDTGTIMEESKEELSSYLISREPSALVENAPNEPSSTDLF